MRTVESQITSAYPSQTNFVVDVSFTWDHDVTFVWGDETVTIEAGRYLQEGRQFFRPGATKITAQTASSSYPVGIAVCKCATIEMYDIGWSNADYWSLYEGATAHLKAAITIDGVERTVYMGSFKVYEVETVHEVTTLTCYDAMKAADVLCPAAMQDNWPYKAAWYFAAQQLGLTAGELPALNDEDLITVDAKNTIRQVIEAVALACGGNAVVSGDTLLVRPITSAADVTLTQWINPVEVAKTPVEVTGVRAKRTVNGQECTYFCGTDGYVIELDDDYLWLDFGDTGADSAEIKYVADLMYSALKEKPIYKFSGDLPADPRLDIFDKVIVKDINGREYPSIITEYTFVFSGKTSVGNSVESGSSYNTSASASSGSSSSGGGADYVVAQGKTGAWTWRKWASGAAEMWAVFGTDTLAIDEAWGGVYFGSWMRTEVNISARKYPFAFTETPAVNASYMGGDADAWLISLFSSSDDLKISAPAYALARPNQGTITTPRIGYYVVGRYKEALA